MDYNDISCLPDPAQPCSSTGYPAYAVQAESAGDVQAAVNFAARTNVRLVIKSTGHDYLGRSSGAGTLSIWTHQMRGLEVNKGDSRVPEYDDGSIASVKVSAGMQWGEIYAEASKQSITVVGGAVSSVGIGGLLTAGGHGPLSAFYGFPGDQVIEMEVVTADGKLRTINAYTHSDLFWAMRGGGSPFAILISVTVKAFPTLPSTIVHFSYSTKADSDTFWSMVAFLHSQLPRISKAGGMGYYTVNSNISAQTPGQKPNPASDGQLRGILIFPNTTSVPRVERNFDRLLTGPFQNASWRVDPISSSVTPFATPDFMSAWSKFPSLAVGTSTRLGSWLLDEAALTVKSKVTKTQLRIANAGGNFPLLGNFVSSDKVKNARVAGGSNSILPAWRHALVHLGMC